MRPSSVRNGARLSWTSFEFFFDFAGSPEGEFVRGSVARSPLDAQSASPVPGDDVDFYDVVRGPSVAYGVIAAGVVADGASDGCPIF